MAFQSPFAVRSNPGYQYSTDAVTTDATPKNVTLYVPKKSQAKQVSVKISAVKSDGSKAAGWQIAATIRCDSSGALTLLGATTLTAEADAGFAPTAEVNVSGANIIAILTGIAATTINWGIDAEVI